MSVMSPGRTDPAPAGDELWLRAADDFARWRAGDAAGLDDLVAVMTPVLWHVVRAYRLPVELAEDVVQGTWLALVRRRDLIDDERAVGRWLTTTARRAAWRAVDRDGRDVAVAPEDLEPFTNTAPSAESAAVEADECSRLWKAVAALDERCQRLLRVVAFLPRPDYAALSSDLDMPVGSIGPTRGRCLAKLRASLGEAFVEGGRA
jgi:RNA polymerase sigma factor (sigma-70 family)